MDNRASIFRGSLLVAGTTIGGGMLALPVLTSLVGFVPSLILYLFCWLFMAGTGLLFLEVSQWMKGEANIVTMAEQTLGRGGKVFSWVVYLFLFYCLGVAYVVGCGNILLELLPYNLPDWAGPLIFALAFSPFILMPTSWASHFNIWLVVGLAASYFGFVFLGFPYVEPQLLKHVDWSYSFMVLPIAFTAFAYHGIIPTLASLMHHNAKSVRKAILIGICIPLVAYVIWQWLILGIIPLDGPNGLRVAIEEGQNAVHPLKFFLYNESVYWLGQSFAFFALITSFLGVTLGLRDFLADGLSIQKDMKGKVILAFLVLFPPLVIAISHPHVFLSALSYAGGFGCALLLGLLPIMMVWRGRYGIGFSSEHQLPGGKGLLLLLACFVLIELTAEFRHLFIRLMFI